MRAGSPTSARCRSSSRYQSTANRCGTRNSPLIGARPRRWWVSSAQQPSLAYHGPPCSGGPSTGAAAVLVATRPTTDSTVESPPGRGITIDTRCTSAAGAPPGGAPSRPTPGGAEPGGGGGGGRGIPTDTRCPSAAGTARGGTTSSHTTEVDEPGIVGGSGGGSASSPVGVATGVVAAASCGPESDATTWLSAASSTSTRSRRRSA